MGIPTGTRVRSRRLASGQARAWGGPRRGSPGSPERAARRRKLALRTHLERDIHLLPPDARNGFAPTRGATRRIDKAAARGWPLRTPRSTRLSASSGALDGSYAAADPANRRRLMQILGSTAAIDRTIADMHECGLLELFIPEFEQVRAMVRIDHYHHFTVDEHMIKSLGVARRIRSGEIGRATPLGRIADQVERWDLLGLALLIHDIGKGFGRGHAIRGGQIAQRIGDRLGLPPEDVDTVRFLVLSHLKLSHAAQRRDPVRPERGAPPGPAEIGSLSTASTAFLCTPSAT